MKNIDISAERIRKELVIWMICLAVSVALNLFSIINYHTRWSELYSQIGYVIIISMVLYFLYFIVRIIISLGKLLLKRP